MNEARRQEALKDYKLAEYYMSEVIPQDKLRKSYEGKAIIISSYNRSNPIPQKRLKTSEELTLIELQEYFTCGDSVITAMVTTPEIQRLFYKAYCDNRFKASWVIKKKHLPILFNKMPDRWKKYTKKGL